MSEKVEPVANKFPLPSMGIQGCDRGSQDGIVFRDGVILETVYGAFRQGELTVEASTRLKEIGKGAHIVVGRYTNDTLDTSA